MPQIAELFKTMTYGPAPESDASSERLAGRARPPFRSLHQQQLGRAGRGQHPRRQQPGARRNPGASRRRDRS